MKKLLRLFVGGWCGLILLSGCTAANTPAPAATALPTVAQPTAAPTSARRGDAITWQGLQVGMDQVEITDSFITEFGFQRGPSAGLKFLWVHVTLKNEGQNEIKLPTAEHFSALYAATEFKPSYGHRQGYADYDTLSATLFPGQQVAAWLRFDLPDAASLQGLRFVFLPESTQVGVSASSASYPWGGEHPVYVWKCAP